MRQKTEPDLSARTLAGAWLLLAVNGGAAAWAQESTDPKEKGKWSGKGELGFVLSRGNSDTETLNANAEVTYDPNSWRHRLRVEWLRARDEGETAAKRFTGTFNTTYEFATTSYAFGAVRYDDDEFSGFNYQSSIAAGYGRYLVNSEQHVLKVEAGPGVRISEPSETGETEVELIARGVMDYTWQLSATASVSDVFLVEAGKDNTFFENKLALTTGVTDSISLKLGISVRRNSDVPDDRENTDYLTTANLVYQFL